jgi:hypothetical protein
MVEVPGPDQFELSLTGPTPWVAFPFMSYLIPVGVVIVLRAASGSVWRQR